MSSQSCPVACGEGARGGGNDPQDGAPKPAGDYGGPTDMASKARRAYILLGLDLAYHKLLRMAGRLRETP